MAPYGHSFATSATGAARCHESVGFSVFTKKLKLKIKFLSERFLQTIIPLNIFFAKKIKFFNFFSNPPTHISPAYAPVSDGH